MPQFVPNGPIVPDKLVQDLEDDRVVIFCGAGISMGAGLPSYRGLVEHCYRELTHPLPDAQSRDWDWPDRMLGSLESRYTPERVRAIVAQRLSRRPRDLTMHRAILRLAQMRRRDGVRLVTTNFDTFFEKARRRMGLRYAWHAGPILPIPKNDLAAIWRSVVYLHGRLGEMPTQQLVLTSADFGRAYLTDAWAARFVARLFADFTVLFIGYSLNDPVLRYMTDAFAAENAEMRSRPSRGPAYIFTHHDGIEAADPQPFLDRNLQPIFYLTTDDHRSLRETLVRWAEWRDDYLANITQLIGEIAPRRPDAIDPTDTANLLWAVAGRPIDQGHGARIFAAVEELPPIEWFDALETRERELVDAHATALAEAERAGREPPPECVLDLGPLFPAMADDRDLVLTPVGFALIHWLVRHLGTEGLVERVLAKLGQSRRPHARLRDAIRHRLAETHGLRDGFVRFWSILSAEGKWLGGGQRRIMPGPAWVARGSLTAGAEPAWLQQELVAGLRPLLELSPSAYRRYREALDPDGAQEEIGDRLSQLADAEVVLADGDHVPGLVEAVSRHPGADAFWAEHIDDLTSLLAEALNLYRVVGEAGPTDDPSTLQRPSIVPHDQNYLHRPWTLLFDLIWQGWTHIDATNAARSRAIVWRWRELPFLAFRRLVAAAVSESPNFTDEERLEVMLGG